MSRLRTLQHRLARLLQAAPSKPANGKTRKFSKCKHCGKKIEEFKDQWWDDKDEFQCPDGEENHQPGIIVTRLE